MAKVGNGGHLGWVKWQLLNHGWALLKQAKPQMGKVQFPLHLMVKKEPIQKDITCHVT